MADKTETHEEDLSKNIGTLEFPQLGISSVYSYPKSSTSPQQSLSTVALAHKRKPAGFEGGQGFNAVDYNVNFEQGAYPQASSFAASPGKSFSGSSKKGGAYDRYLGYVEGGTSIPDPSAFNAVREHEGQHSIFHEIGKRFGVKSREEVARKLFDSLDPEHQATLTTLASHSGYIPQSPFFHEEALLQPVNYLMSSEFRQKAPQIHGAVKEAWKQIREKAKMIETPTVKSEEDLEKNIGFLTFPKLGVHQLPTMPYTGGSPKAEMIHFGEDAGYSKGQMRYTHEQRGPTDPKDRKMHGYVKSGSTMTMPRGTQVNLETHGTAAHEGQHSAFARVGQVNSVAAQMKLARFLHDQLNPREQDALQKIASRSGYVKPPEGQRFKAFDYYEEVITSLQNYLQDKSFRSGVHEDLLKMPIKDDTHHGRIFQDNDPVVAKYPQLLTPKSLHDTAKSAWRKLMDVAPHVEYDRDIRNFAVKRPDAPVAKSEESAKKRKVVASVAVFNPQEKMLWGLRNDTGKWTMPGGHLEEGEKPLKGAIRELFEEAGLKPTDIESLGNEEVDSWDGKSKILVHAFKAMCDGKAHSKNDPDEECDKWDWVGLKDGKLPEEIMSKLHSPKNVTLKLLGLQDWGDMNKSEDALVKAIADIAPGKLIGKKGPSDRLPSVSYIYDYSHLLPEHARNGEYSIELHYTPANPDMPHGDGLYVTHLNHNGKSVGVVLGEHQRSSSSIDTHSTVNEPYKGKKFGKALYTAALTHAYHVLNAKEVKGQPLSDEASYVHSSLAREHGMDYKPTLEGEVYSRKDQKTNKVYSHLGYTIKQEDDLLDTLTKFEAIIEKLTKGQKTALTSDTTVTDLNRAPKHEMDLNFYRITPEVVKEYAQYGREGTLKGAQYVSSPGASVGSSPTVAFDNPEDLHNYIKDKYEPFVVKNVLPSNGSTVFLAPIPIRSMAHDNGHRYLNLDHMHGVSVAQDRRYRVPFYYTVAKDQMDKGYKHPMFAPLIAEYKPGYGADSHHLRITDGNGRSVSARTAGATHMLSYVQVKPEHVPDFLKMIHETTNDPELHVRRVMGTPELPSEFHIHQIPDLVENVQKSETLKLLSKVEAVLNKLV